MLETVELFYLQMVATLAWISQLITNQMILMNKREFWKQVEKYIKLKQLQKETINRFKLLHISQDKIILLFVNKLMKENYNANMALHRE